MRKFQIEVKNLTLEGTTKYGAKTYTASVRLIDLINANNQLGQSLYSVNVRGRLFTGKVPDRKNKTFQGIEETLTNIHNGIDEPVEFLNNNTGSLLICNSLNQLDENKYEVILIGNSNGIGNGQQTITISSFINNKLPISDDVYILVKIMIGYPVHKCYNSCKSNNTSNKISQKNIISNGWVNVANDLKQLGYDLYYQQTKNIPKLPNVINIYESGFYNILNAYQTKQPWITGDKVANNIDINLLNANSVIEVFNLKKQIDNWFKLNLNPDNTPYDLSFFDSTRTGYIKNIIIAAYQNGYKNILTQINSSHMDEFFKISFEVIYGILQLKGTVRSNFFTNKDNCENLMTRIDTEIIHIENVMTKRLNENLNKTLSKLRVSQV